MSEALKRTQDLVDQVWHLNEKVKSDRKLIKKLLELMHKAEGFVVTDTASRSEFIAALEAAQNQARGYRDEV